MTKEIRINGFAMNCAGHLSPGLWTHPRDGSASYNDIDYWTDLAKIFERGKFDAMFLADVLGVYDVYQGSVDAALRHGAQVPVNDPAIIVPAMAQVTKNLCFTMTATVSFEPPYPFARRMSTLDHVTRGPTSAATAFARRPTASRRAHARLASRFGKRLWKSPLRAPAS